MTGNWCVIVVPGAGRQPLNSLRNHIVDCLNAGEALHFEDAGGSPQDAIRSLKPVPDAGVQTPFQQLDLVEAYWADLIPSDSETQPHRRLSSALGLVTYWIADPKVWQAVFSASWFIALSYMLTGALVLAWAFSVITVALGALGPAIVAFVATPQLSPLHDVAGQADALAATLKGSAWSSWAQVIATLLPLLSLIAIIDLARFSRAYLLNRTVGITIGVQATIRNRLRNCFVAARKKDYDRIVIVAHSFGTLPLVDMLADWDDAAAFANLKVITLGSPAGIFAFKSDWLREQITMAVARSPANGWIDFTLHNDFWCTGLLNRQHGAVQERVSRSALNRQSSLIDGLNGAQHMRYFEEASVLQAITA